MDSVEYIVCLFTVQNYGSSIAISFFDVHDLTIALKYPNEKLEKVLSDEKIPVPLNYDMQNEIVQRYFFEDILQVIRWYIKNNKWCLCISYQL